MKKRNSIFACSLAVIMATQMHGCVWLAVGATATAAKVIHDRRDIGTQINDQTIELRLKSKLNADPTTKRSHIVVVSENFHVLLAGEAATQSAASEATRIANSEPGVRKVWNQLRVQPNSGAFTRSNDVLTTGRVKTGMIQIKLPGFDPTRVNVTTTNGVVHLMGKVTQEEANAVKIFARTVYGVQGVVALFEITPNANYL